eukprot:364633-Chlamydomonas_euryale.AAC.8
MPTSSGRREAYEGLHISSHTSGTQLNGQTGHVSTPHFAGPGPARCTGGLGWRGACPWGSSGAQTRAS